MRPLPVLPPNLRADLGEGECAVFMKTVFPVQVIVTPLPQLCCLPRCSLRGQLGEGRVGKGPPPSLPTAGYRIGSEAVGRVGVRPREDGQRGNPFQGRVAGLERVIEYH